MLLSTGDWLLIAAYFAISLGLGLALSRRGGASLSDYFLSGRQTPWWLAGLGMVATTFAADTPLAVTGLVRERGVSGNWIWWSAAIGGALTVFFFARLWRRAGVLTDLEFIELRYGGKPAAFLRGFKAIYFGLFLNVIVMAWVNLAMLRIAEVLFPEIDARLVVVVAACSTLIYVAVTGLWGIAIADAFQFTVAMVGCIALAWIASEQPAVQAAGGIGGMQPPTLTAFFPDLSGEGGLGSIALSAFLAYILVQWWASWYPGAEPGGGGYIAQRIMSARNEKHGVLAALFFLIAHYCLRPWPWIVAALAAVAIYPVVDPARGETEASYVFLIRDLLGSPWRGLLAAAFLGAYMSTIATHMNWGASYIVNDFLRRFKIGGDAEHSSIATARLVSLLLLAISLWLSFTYLQTVKGAWEFLLSCTAGMGFVLILRWYWWRVNAAAEIASMIAPALIVVALTLIEIHSGWRLPSPQNLFVIAPLAIVLTLLAMYLRPPESAATLRAFFDRVRPEGPGWFRLSGDRRNNSWSSLLPNLLGWAAAIVLVYTSLFSAGAFIFGRATEGLIWALAAVVAAVLVVVLLRRQWENER